MKRPISQRRESVQDYQRPIRRRQFSPSPIRKSQSSRTSSHAKVPKVQSQNAAFQPSCTTNNKENFGLEPEIKVQAERQKKAALIDLKRQAFPAPMSKQKSCDSTALRNSAERGPETKPLDDTHNLIRATSF